MFLNILEKFVFLNISQSCLSFYADFPSDCRALVEASQEDDEVDPSGDDDSSAFRARPDSGGSFTALRWSTRRFAMECICRIIAQCESADPAHFDMALAQERRLHESTGKTHTMASFAWFCQNCRPV